MRTVFLLPLALAAAAVAGCGTASEGREQAALRTPRRDLTLRPADAVETEVASPVELGSTPVQRPTTHRLQRSRRPAPARRPQAIEAGGAPATPAPAPAPAATVPAFLAASTAPQPADPHELAPGQSVTVIPASSGPSTAPEATPDWTDERPSGARPGIAVGGGGSGGGGCRPGGAGGSGGGFRGLR